MEKKQTVLTGITTSGTPHLGNLVGAILPAIQASSEKQNKSFLFLADYHSLIKNTDSELTHASSFEIAACWLACGLDPKEVVFYRQSDISHIFELAWILGCMTSKGLLNRAHAYKAALAENENAGSSDLDKGITMGLYNYPILMAADILMFNADIVPVGQDQKQHIEMTRDIALRFNHHYGELLTPPEAQISETNGILPGLDGRKMSKSYNNTIPIFLDEKKLKKSVMKIKTNSLEPGEPKDSSTCTVFSLYKAISSESDLNELQIQYDNGIAWGDAKTILFDRLNEFLKPYKNEYDRIIEDRGYVEQVLMDGANTAKEVSTPLIEKIRSAVGIRGF